MFHQYLFKIFNCRMVRRDKRKQPRSRDLFFFFCASADCLEAKVTPDRDRSMMFSG